MNLEALVTYYRDVLGIRSFIASPPRPKLHIFFQATPRGEALAVLNANATFLNILKAIGLKSREVTIELGEQAAVEQNESSIGTARLFFHLERVSSADTEKKIFRIPHPSLLESYPDLKKEAWQVLKQIPRLL